jgi:hypothetical protein
MKWKYTFIAKDYAYVFTESYFNNIPLKVIYTFKFNRYLLNISSLIVMNTRK